MYFQNIWDPILKFSILKLKKKKKMAGLPGSLGRKVVDEIVSILSFLQNYFLRLWGLFLHV